MFRIVLLGIGIYYGINAEALYIYVVAILGAYLDSL